MLDILSPFISLASLVVLCIFLVVKCRVPAGVAPLISLSFAVLWFGAFGMLGLLVLGGWAWFIVCVALLVFTAEYKPAQNNYKKLATPAFVFFVAAAALFTVYLAIRQPMLHEWDEFSFWGTAVKILKTQGVLHPFGDFGWKWPATELPALPLIGYFAQFFGGFAAWKIYAGYAFLFFAVIAAVLGLFKRKDLTLAVAIGFVCLLVPAFLTVYARQYVTHLVWLNSYSNIPAGMLLGGTLASYFVLKEEKAPLWPFAIVLCFMALVRLHFFTFALLAAGVAAVDLIFFSDKVAKVPTLAVRAKDVFRIKKNKIFVPKAGEYTLLHRIRTSVTFFITPLIPFVLWSKYTALAVAKNAAAGGTGATSSSTLSLTVDGLKMLFGLMPRTKQFSRALEDMIQAFFSFKFEFVQQNGKSVLNFVPEAKLNMLGGNIAITLFILAIFVVAIIAAGKGVLRKRTITAMVLSTLGFVGYYIELIISYGLLFKPGDAAGLVSYNRYVYSYYIGWFLLAIFFLGFTLQTKKKDSLLRGVAFALCVLMVVRVPMLLPVENSDIGYPDAYFSQEEKYEELAQNVLEAIPEESPRIFYVHQYETEGELWFVYSYYLLPAVLDYSEFGGVPMAKPGIDDNYYEQMTPEELQLYLTSNNCQYMFIPYIDESFIESYGHLFTDNGQGAWDKTTFLYRVVVVGSALSLEPVEMEV